MVHISEPEPHHHGNGIYLKDLVYGAVDGTVTTFAVVAGVAGAALSPAIVLILGFANLFADGFSMAISNYLSIKADRDYAARARKRETWEVENTPDEEREEIREILLKKGFNGKELETAVEIITSNKEHWIDTMMHEELGIMVGNNDPKKHALATFLSFVLVGIIPLLAYVLSYFLPFFAERTFVISAVLTSFTFFLVGAAKTFFTKQNWMVSGIRTFAIGGLAAVVAYGMGAFIKTLVG
ncbi:MAG: hypothetical protein COW88_03030 [Candidatus Lloydbacteria bacterium CG22_combo_CG10-13_8_21_14_all_47_15]|uniref:GMP synthase n=1 Tax=Candidatus Lloydbacteria bacterium CG22_combo_CG10-13_8_21_14_all_47_15 TaxID=1974635 RepID=A0A2H0CUN3_9BACT|nr:MAG: hypothetical protein COW88_03030 [Candidatus Lloydbacteria bacterium CG22_combo_CG10-13_8_21_14_all_47_15]